MYIYIFIACIIWYVSIDSCSSCMLWRQRSKETQKTNFQTPHGDCDCLLSFLFCKPPNINAWQIEISINFLKERERWGQFFNWFGFPLQKHKGVFVVASLKNCFMRIIRDGNCSGHGLATRQIWHPVSSIDIKLIRASYSSTQSWTMACSQSSTKNQSRFQLSPINEHVQLETTYFSEMSWYQIE